MKILILAAATLLLPVYALAQIPNAHRVLATNKTSTMQKEMQEAGAGGFRFAAVMGGETAVGGKEVGVVMQKTRQDATRYEYRLLATNKTSTLEKELKEAGDASFEVVGMTVGKTLVGGNELVAITRRAKK